MDTVYPLGGKATLALTAAEIVLASTVQGGYDTRPIRTHQRVSTTLGISICLPRSRPERVTPVEPVFAALRSLAKELAVTAALLMIVPALQVHGEETVPSERLEPGAGPPQSPGRLSMLLLGGAMMEHKDDIFLRYGVAAFEYGFSERFAGLAELVRYDVRQEPSGSTDGLGFNLLGALNIYRTRRMAFFGAVGLGLADFQHRMPLPDGTHFNFTIHGRLGIRWLLGDRFWLQAAAQYMHLSNANIEGEERNPSFDGFGGYGGLVVRF